jgi:hypothetical protein
MRRLLAAIALSSLALTAFAACLNQDPDTSVSATPGPIPASTASPLHDAREDLATRLRISPGTVELARIQDAGFDGCLGVSLPNQPCTQQFIAGFIAHFTAGNREYRYHLGDSRFVAADFQPAGTRVVDGMEVPPEMRTGLIPLLARYAAHDLALRLRLPAQDITVAAIAPAGMSSSCKGFETQPGQACTDDLIPGAAVFLEAAGTPYRYHVTTAGILATNFEQGTVTLSIPAPVLDVQLAMREDLARRTNTPLPRVSIVDYRDVTWPNGCLGVDEPGTVCTQALVPGFLAFLSDNTNVYRYHGAETGGFIAASFVTNATLSEPLPRDP